AWRTPTRSMRRCACGREPAPAPPGGARISEPKHIVGGAMYLITGGAGFIGANLAEALVNAGERVRILDNFSTGSIDNLASIRARVEIVEGDLRDYEAVKRAMRGVKYVAHQAALRSVERSVDDPLSSDDVNTHGTLHVLMAARDTSGVQRVV